MVLLLAAFEGGFAATGNSERSRTTANRGWIEKSFKKANGSVTQDIELERSGRHMEATVTLEVGEGTFHIELLDGQGNVTLSLEATSGRPTSGSGFMETNSFGNARYRVTVVEAKEVTYRIAFDTQ